MTKERFKVVETIINDDRRIYELTKNDVGYYNFRSEKLLASIICNKLNKLLEENEQLKETNKRLHDKLQNVTSLESLKIGETTKLQAENKRLRSILRIYRDVANCYNCDYHDYDCRSDGDDFEVCEKGHDMSYSICKDWREL